MTPLRIGNGHDVHRLVEGRPLWIGGVEVPFEKGAEAHSDGDVLLHALCDALLGAAGQNDIGTLYPDTDSEWKDAPGERRVRGVMDLLGKSWALVNVDCTVFLERPKLKEHKVRIRERMAEILGIPAARINVKAKTMEGMGPIGAGEGIGAQVSVLLQVTEQEQDGVEAL